VGWGWGERSRDGEKPERNVEAEGRETFALQAEKQHLLFEDKPDTENLEKLDSYREPATRGSEDRNEHNRIICFR
jgi:hypothetical protein